MSKRSNRPPPREVRQRAVRLVQEHRGEYAGEKAALINATWQPNKTGKT